MSGNNPNYVLVAAGAALVFSLLLLARNPDSIQLFQNISFSTKQESLEIIPIPNQSGFKDNQAPATTGKLFKGEVIAYFDPKERKFATFSNYDISSKKINRPSLFDTPCKHWSVLTTIFDPTPASERQANIENWCFVVVGDKSSVSNFYNITTENENNRVIFLNTEKQIELSKNYGFVNMLPWKSFTRKNIGYMYAIINDAETIWDFDDDNLLISSEKKFSIPGIGYFKYKRNSSEAISVMEVHGMPTEHNALNPYPLMGATTNPCWPRGYPLDLIKENTSTITVTKSSLHVSRVGIIQSLANHDPDVDAIYRLTQPLPFYFDTKTAETEDFILAIPSSRYTPYNAQATLHLYPSLWSMLLPTTVHGRVADIWRGYIFQRLAQDIGIRLVMSPAMVVQDRNSHSYLADFDSEEQLYHRSHRLIQQLAEWKPSSSSSSSSLPTRIEELWIFLYERGYLGRSDVYLVQSWIQTLLDCGYEFPKLIE